MAKAPRGKMRTDWRSGGRRERDLPRNSRPELILSMGEGAAQSDCVLIEGIDFAMPQKTTQKLDVSFVRVEYSGPKGTRKRFTSILRPRIRPGHCPS
jgi:hypothetical protein